MQAEPKTKASKFLRQDAGTASIWGLGLTVATMLVGGLALDGSNAWRVQRKMQAASDAAALAAAQKLPDIDAARAMALEVAQKNLGDNSMDEAAITAEDVKFGKWTDANGFTETDDDPDAVIVDGSRTVERNNQLGTMLLGLVGVDYFEPTVASTAISASRETAGATLSCEDAAIISSNYVELGGGSSYTGDLCVHGTTGVHGGGYNYFGPGVHLSALSKSLVTIGTTQAGSASADEIARASDLSPVVLPKLDSMFDALWTDVSKNLVNPNGNDLNVDGYYTGTLFPDYLKDSTGKIAIVYLSSGRWFQPSEVQPNTIYISNGNVGVGWGAVMDTDAFLVKGSFQLSGGYSGVYDHNYIFATGDVSLADSKIGNPNTYCTDGKYTNYIFSKTRVNTGGGSALYGIFGAAPTYEPGGGYLNAGGYYFETSNYSSLGGGMSIAGCGKRLDAMYDSAIPTEQVSRVVAGKLKR